MTSIAGQERIKNAILEIIDANTDIGAFSDGYSDPDKAATKIMELLEKEYHCGGCDGHDIRSPRKPLGGSCIDTIDGGFCLICKLEST